MKEIKKEDDEVSIKSLRKSSRNGKQGKRYKSKRISRIRMRDKLIATLIQPRRSQSTLVLSISMEAIFAI